ncbi:RNA-dependent RNA polymerase [Beihai noda-like virus 11]|uniref:RNA-dependent RNA polymerase n=1 Tax=Beihai noda-like virus 11 TaxID=1922464 RepID=UPI00090B6821|nr:RNA-dependent RNA polymerase [Beihai noda-like virus 11]APG76126.1 RNA-dependent RNA polymerase [Beihai noda-like virus 11]
MSLFHFIASTFRQGVFRMSQSCLLWLITAIASVIGETLNLPVLIFISLAVFSLSIVAVVKMARSDWFANRLLDLRHQLIGSSVIKIPTASHLRSTVQKKLEMTKCGVRRGHSHQQAATERNSATETMLDFVTSNGYIPYVISPSPREAGIDGRRRFYSLADLRQNYLNDPLTDKHIIVMTDVDYYVNMHELISLGRPILCYTFQPSTVSGPVKDGYFTIKDDVVHYHVNGGKDVQHRIWNYNQDTIYVVDPENGFWATLRQIIYDLVGLSWLSSICHKRFGIGPFGRKVTICTVDQFKLSDHRNIVSIVPFAKCRENLLPFEEYGQQLRRMQYGAANPTEQFNTLIYLGDGDPLVSLGVAGQVASVQLPLRDLEAMMLMHNDSKTANLSDTVRRARATEKSLTEQQAAIVHHYLLSMLPLKPDVVHKPGQLARHYQATDVKYDHDCTEQGREYARTYAPGPLSQTAVFPNESRANERATIDGRVVGPQTKAKARENITQRLRKYAKDFVKQLVPNPGAGFRYSVAHVEEQQQKPLQRARNDANRMHHAISMITKSFQKKEAYGAPNHPRNISTVPHGQNARLSGYTYAFKDAVLKKTEWYMPCKTPAQIAEAVVNLAAKSTELVETDYSRFDGTFLRFMREHVEFACYKRWVPEELLPELSELLNNEVDSKARTRLGLTYAPGCSRLSGSPLTTDGNSICNAFVSYAAGRYSGASHEEAWDDIGIVYGDDGLRSGSVPDELLSSTASDLGFELKICNRASRGQSVSFLSRIFCDPWSSPASIQDPARTLLKIHTTCDGSNKTIQEIGWAKTQAYLATDRLTPFISDWCLAYQRNCPEQLVNYDDYTDIPFWVRDEDSLNNSWPQSDNEIWVGIVANRLGVTASELDAHIKKLRAFTGRVEDLPVLTSHIDQTPKLEVAMDGEIHAGPSSVNKKTENGPNHHGDREDSGTAETAVPTSRGSPAKPGRAVPGRGKRDANVCAERERKGGRNQASAIAHSNSASADKPHRRRPTPQVSGPRKPKV